MAAEDEPSGVLPLLEADLEPHGPTAHGRPGVRDQAVGVDPTPGQASAEELVGVDPSPGQASAEELVASLSRLTADSGAISLVDLDGGAPGRDLSPVSTGGGSVSDMEAAGPAPEPSLATPQPDQDVLQLDFDAPGRGVVDGPEPARGRDRARATRESSAGDPTLVAPETVGPKGSPSPSPGPLRLLGDDVVFAGLVAATAGLVLGLLVATEVGRRLERDEVVPLHDELQESVNRPLAARAGKIRTADRIREDLERVHGEARITFLLTWLLCALPVAGGTFLIKRPR